MDFTNSHARVVQESLRTRYRFIEVRNAAAIFLATNPTVFEEFEAALTTFELLPEDLIQPGGQETQLARRFNTSFRDLGWREARVDTDIELSLRIMPYAPAGEKEAAVTSTRVANKGYKVDNFKERIALDLEWNAKDGNLDRDISAYRALYDAGLIDLGVIVTRTSDDLRALGYDLRIAYGMSEADSKKVLGTTTTTNIEKLSPRLSRGDAGGCPILAVAICADTMSKD